MTKSCYTQLESFSYQMGYGCTTVLHKYIGILHAVFGVGRDSLPTILTYKFSHINTLRFLKTRSSDKGTLERTCLYKNCKAMFGKLSKLIKILWLKITLGTDAYFEKNLHNTKNDIFVLLRTLYFYFNNNNSVTLFSN